MEIRSHKRDLMLVQMLLKKRSLKMARRNRKSGTTIKAHHFSIEFHVKRLKNKKGMLAVFIIHFSVLIIRFQFFFIKKKKNCICLEIFLMHNLKLCAIVENHARIGEKSVRQIKRHLDILRCVHLRIAVLEDSWVDVAAVVGT